MIKDCTFGALEVDKIQRQVAYADQMCHGSLEQLIVHVTIFIPTAPLTLLALQQLALLL